MNDYYSAEKMYTLPKFKLTYTITSEDGVVEKVKIVSAKGVDKAKSIVYISESVEGNTSGMIKFVKVSHTKDS